MFRNVATSFALCSGALVAPGASAGDPKSIPYDGCGLLVAGSECLEFHGDDGVDFPLPFLIKPYQPGDHIYVQGELCFGCPSLCQADASFAMKSISPCSVSFDMCGTLAYGGSLPFFCIVLQADDGSTWAIDNQGEFDVGDQVRIVGQPGGCPPADCGEIDGCIAVTSIHSCGEFVDECGTITTGAGIPHFCLLFTGDSGNTYFIEDTSFFSPGSRVRVSGVTSAPCPFSCGEIDGCIYQNTIGGCADVNQDGNIDVNDLILVIDAWGLCPADCPPDLTFDGQVNVDDLVLVITQWGD